MPLAERSVIPEAERKENRQAADPFQLSFRAEGCPGVQAAAEGNETRADLEAGVRSRLKAKHPECLPQVAALLPLGRESFTPIRAVAIKSSGRN